MFIAFGIHIYDRVKIVTKFQGNLNLSFSAIFTVGKLKGISNYGATATASIILLDTTAGYEKND